MRWIAEIARFLEGIFTREERMALGFLIGIGVAGMGLWICLGPSPHPKTAFTLLFVHVNTATAAELASLPGIGPVMAERIVSDRQYHGCYVALSDLARVKGMNRNLLDKIKGYIRFN